MAKTFPEVRDSDPTLFVDKPLPALPASVARLMGTPPPARPRAALPPPMPPTPVPVTPVPPPHLPPVIVFRRYDTRALVKIVGLMAGALLMGTLAGVLVVKTGEQQVQDVAVPPPQVAEPAPVVTPLVPLPATPASEVVTVDFDSRPRGAEVTLIGGEKAVFVGTTPITVSIDRKQVYDAVFTLEGHAARVERVAPIATRRVMVDLGAVGVRVPPTDRKSEHLAAQTPGT